MIVVVLGMHKSGTTLVARLLHEAGIDMGTFDDTGAYDDGNMFERPETLALNLELLQATLETPSYKIGSAPAAPAEVLSRMRALVESLSRAHKDWGFKDPRTCLTYETWRACLPAHKLVVVFRHPGEVWAHYAPSVSRGPARLVDCYRVFRTWYRHNSQCLAAARAVKDSYLVNYSRLMDAGQTLDDFSQFLGRRLVDKRDIGLYRSRPRDTFPANIVRSWLLRVERLDVHKLYAELEAERLKRTQAMNSLLMSTA